MPQIREREVLLDTNPVIACVNLLLRIDSALALIGAIAMLLLALSSAVGRGVNTTVEHGREIEASFQVARSYVDEYIRAKSRLPTTEEFKAWTEAYPASPYTPNGLWLTTTRFAPEILNRNGPPPKLGYVLEYWRGEWSESYVSWSGATSLELDESAFYLLHSRAFESAIFSVACVVFLFCSRFAWRVLKLRTTKTIELS